jgi:hypothetical protein
MKFTATQWLDQAKKAGMTFDEYLKMLAALPNDKERRTFIRSTGNGTNPPAPDRIAPKGKRS